MSTAAWLIRRFLILFLACLGARSGAAPAFDITPGRLDVAGATGFPFADIVVPISRDPATSSLAGVVVASDAPWLTAHIDDAASILIVKVSPADFPASTYSGNVTLTGLGVSDSLLVEVTLAPLQPVLLRDDPARGRMYGLHQNGDQLGALVTFDPRTLAPLGQVTVGRQPTDFAVSADGREVFVICAGVPGITVVDAETLVPTEWIELNAFASSAVLPSSPRIEVGPADILYYTDAGASNSLRVLKRSNGQVLQAIKADTIFRDGLGRLYGWGDFIVTPDRETLVGWARNSGAAGIYCVRHTVAADGTLTFAETSRPGIDITGNDSGRINRPALASADGSVFAACFVALDSRSPRVLRARSPADIYALTPERTLFTTDNSIHDLATGRLVANLPAFSEVQAFTSDRTSLVFYDRDAKYLDRIDLRTALGSDYPEIGAAPAHLATVCSPERLTWPAVPGAHSYHVFLGQSESLVNQATVDSEEYLGETAAPFFELTSPLEEGATYFWRIDSTGPAIATTSTVRSFRVTAVTPSSREFRVSTIEGNSHEPVTLSLASTGAGAPWSLTSSVPWISLTATSGVTPAQVELRIDASALSAGFHAGEVRLSTSTGTAAIPIHLELAPLAVTVLRSEVGTDRVFGLSETLGEPLERAHLLEIDATTGRIVRAVAAGGSATSLAIHPGDNRIYVANWLVGSLLAFDRTTLSLVRTYPFQRFLGMGLNRFDVFTLSAGGPGRLMIEDADQSIDIRLFDTDGGSVLSSVVGSEGIGSFAPDARYFYHGEYNSSAARLVRLDTSGDRIELANTASYIPPMFLQDPALVVSESGQRVFWYGAVFDAELNLLWANGEVIGATTPDGTLGFAKTRIYDTVNQRAVLGSPVNSPVSAFNATAQRLVMQKGQRIATWSVDPSATPPAPVVAVASVEADRAHIQWSDNSLETGFDVQWRIVGTATWTGLATPLAENTTTHTVFPLVADRNYEFRVRAVTANAVSDWSTPAAAQTPAWSGTPELALQTLGSKAIQVSWVIRVPHDSVVIERKLFGALGWSTIATVSGSTTTHADTGLRPNTRYVYRITPMSGSTGLTSSNEIWRMTDPAVSVPVFSQHPAHVVAMAGSPVTLSCRVAGTGPITVRWYRNGVPVADGNQLDLQLTAHPSLEGHYAAEATNALGKTVSLSATLTVVPSKYAGIHFGGFANSAGEWALLARPDGTATALFALRAPTSVAVIQTTVDHMGRLETSVPFTRPDGTPTSATAVGMSISDGTGPVPRGTVSGSVGLVAAPLSGISEPATGPFEAMAGLHIAPQIGGGSGMLWTILGPTGRSVTVTIGRDGADGSIAIVPDSGALEFTGVGGSSFALALTPAQRSVVASVKRTGAPQADFASILPSDLRTDRLVNISSRGFTDTGNDVMIAGFYISGDSPRQVLVRCAGPALARWEVAGLMDDPSLSLHDRTDERIASNDDWSSASNASLVQAAARRANAFAFAEGSKDAALLIDLPPGSYTAIARGSTPGVVLTEIYDVTGIDTASQSVTNLSIRARVGSADAIVVGGFVILGNSPKRVLIRGVGPTLAGFGLSADSVLPDPRLELYSGSVAIAENDDWQDTDDAAAIAAYTAEMSAFKLPAGSRDAAMVAVLQPGSYTAHVRGSDGTTGICLLEVYQLP